MITNLNPEKQEEKKASADDMTYQDMINFTKENNLKPASNKKADLIKTIKEFLNA